MNIELVNVEQLTNQQVRYVKPLDVEIKLTFDVYTITYGQLPLVTANHMNI